MRAAARKRVPSEGDTTGRPRRLHRDVTPAARQAAAPLIAQLLMLHQLSRPTVARQLPDSRTTVAQQLRHSCSRVNERCCLSVDVTGVSV